MPTKDRVTGMFLGVAIGDALGAPVEMYSCEQIAEKYGRISGYLNNSDHKWFSKALPGSTTDDWQLTKAIIMSFIEKSQFDLNDIIRQHVKTLRYNGAAAWGGSTFEAVCRLAGGADIKESGSFPTKEKQRGAGNGVVMKLSPISAFCCTLDRDGPQWFGSLVRLGWMTRMTHPTNIAIECSGIHMAVLANLLTNRKGIVNLTKALRDGLGASCYCLDSTGFDQKKHSEFITMAGCVEKIYRARDKPLLRDISERFKGSCYVKESLALSYAIFAANPRNIEALYDAVNAGGDTDSNASIVGSMLGAVHGTKIFPKDLVDGLQVKDEVFELSEKFCKATGVTR